MDVLRLFPAPTRFSSLPLAGSSSINKNGQKGWALSPRRVRVGLRVQDCFNPFADQPIVTDALKEPVAFVGGMFAGLLRLDLNEDPLKEWIVRSVKAAGIKPDEEAGAKVDEKEDSRQIEID
ncbi:UPF0426 protein [Platanthera guangdongensis]|uniref:UPF0426 protein n=1 Tax=Platanthera guangdongensis TaxID=2320717 RepID=A0ABR2LNK5_9ASPA